VIIVEYYQDNSESNSLDDWYIWVQDENQLIYEIPESAYCCQQGSDVDDYVERLRDLYNCKRIRISEKQILKNQLIKAEQIAWRNYNESLQLKFNF